MEVPSATTVREFSSHFPDFLSEIKQNGSEVASYVETSSIRRSCSTNSFLSDTEEQRDNREELLADIIQESTREHGKNENHLQSSSLIGKATSFLAKGEASGNQAVSESNSSLVRNFHHFGDREENQEVQDHFFAFVENGMIPEQGFLKRKVNGDSLESGIGTVSVTSDGYLSVPCDTIHIDERFGSSGIGTGDGTTEFKGDMLHEVRGMTLQHLVDVELVNETLMIQPFSVIEGDDDNGTGNVYEQFSNKGNMAIEKKRKSRRRGKCAKRILERKGSLDMMEQAQETQFVITRSDLETKRTFSRKQLEALRFVDTEAQKRLWNTVYSQLGHVLSKEYDSLACSGKQKRVRSKAGSLLGKKELASPIVGSLSKDSIEIYGDDETVADMLTAEEDCDEDTYIDEDYSSLLRPAFLIEGEPDFESGPPEDGLEYLRRVRWEAAQIPNVKVAKIDRSKLEKEQTFYMPKIPSIPCCPPQLQPLKAWEDAFLSEFSKLRQALSFVENSDEPEPAFTFHETRPLPTPAIIEHMGSEADPEDVPETDLKTSFKQCTDELDPDIPTVHSIRKMDSVTRIAMLRKQITLAESSMDCPSRNHFLWLFALCAAMDMPLGSDSCASMRALLRKCCMLRAVMTEMSDDVAMLNVIITIAGQYFGQLETSVS